MVLGINALIMTTVPPPSALPVGIINLSTAKENGWRSRIEMAPAFWKLSTTAGVLHLLRPHPKQPESSKESPGCFVFSKLMKTEDSPSFVF